MSFMVTSKRKLLFVIPSLVGDGAQRVLVDLINHLDRNKYDILLVIFDKIMDLQKDLHSSIKIVCLEKRSRWVFFKLILKLRGIIRDYKPVVVISHLHYTNLVTGLANMLLKRSSRLILCEHSYPRKYLPKDQLGYIKRWLMKITYRKADRIVTVSKSIKRVLEDDFNIKPKNIISIYNPIPLEAIRDKSQKEVEHTFFKDKNTQVIISAGRLAEEKRLDNLLRAFAIVKTKQKDARLIILGKGYLRNELEVLSSNLNIDKCVDFVGYQSNPFAWISKADIFVLSSDYEGLPMVILETMACGTPIVSTNCPSGPREIITNGKNGILVPPGDEEALARAIFKLLKDEKLRKKFSEGGKKRAEDFRIEKIIPQYEELF